MLIYAKFSYIFQSPVLVDIPWSVPKPGRTNMVSTYQFNRFKDSTPYDLASGIRLHGTMFI